MSTAVWAVAAALILGWGLAGARPADRVEDPHAGIPCAGCHMRAASGPAAVPGGEAPAGADTLAAPASRRAPSAADLQCASCHDRLDRASRLAAAFHGPGSEACTVCHSFHDTATLTAGPQRFRYAFGEPSLRMQCASCHVTGGNLAKVTDGHRDAAAALYHVDASRLAGFTPSEPCLFCHADGAGNTNLPASAAEAPRFHREATHPYGEPMPFGHATGGYSIRRKPDPRIMLFDGRIECRTCHDMADDVEDLLVRFEEKYDLCLGCHQRHPAAAGPALAASGSLSEALAD